MVRSFIAVFCLALYVRLSLGYHCRQCQGTQTITFKTDVNAAQAVKFLQYSLGGCATAYDFDIQNIVKNGRVWTFTVKVWRYCGSGGSNYVERGARCLDDICVTADRHVLTCNKTVACRGECDPIFCGA